MDDWTSITDKQRLAISLTEKNLPGIKFVGSTRKDASEFIGQYMERSMAIGKRKKPDRPLFSDNEHQLKFYCFTMDGFFGEKLLDMPDMTVAYIPEEWE